MGQALHSQDGTLRGPQMTPVQGAAIAAVLANDGILQQPHLVEEVGGVSVFKPRQATAVSSATAAQMMECLQYVVEAGTGRNAAVEGATVWGKTGTAERGNGIDDGWFIGCAKPEQASGPIPCAFAVVIEGAESSEACQVAAAYVREAVLSAVQ